MNGRACILGMGIASICAAGWAADSVIVAGRRYPRVEFALGDGTAGVEKRPSLAYSSAADSMMATWDTGDFIHCRKFGWDGMPLTGDLPVGGGGFGDTWYSDLDSLPGGAFMVATEHHPTRTVMDVYARAIGSDGQPATDLFQVDHLTFELCGDVVPDLDHLVDGQRCGCRARQARPEGSQGVAQGMSHDGLEIPQGHIPVERDGSNPDELAPGRHSFTHPRAAARPYDPWRDS